MKKYRNKRYKKKADHPLYIYKKYFKFILVFCLISAILAGCSSYAQPAPTDKDLPVLPIILYYSNPCESCTVADDYKAMLDQYMTEMSGTIKMSFEAIRTFNPSGKQMLDQTLDMFDRTGVERQFNEYMVIGETLLSGSGQIEEDMKIVLEQEAENLLKDNK